MSSSPSLLLNCFGIKMIVVFTISLLYLHASISHISVSAQPDVCLCSAAAEEAWESDDNLSDGGDFFEEEDFQPSPLDPLKATIPVVPAVQVTDAVGVRDGGHHLN